MNVSSVKNLNGEVFSAVQDASLTNVVQTNSGNWQDITAYQNASATYLTAVDFSPYATTAEVDTLSSMLSGAIDYVSANAGDEFPVSADEAIQYVENNSATINDVSTTYQNNSATYLTAHQAISANEWNSNYETVNTNSGVWGGSALPISAGPGIKVNLVDNTLVFSNDETVLYSGVGTTAATLAEPITNFESIKVTYYPNEAFYDSTSYITEFPSTNTLFTFNVNRFNDTANNAIAYFNSLYKVQDDVFTEIQFNHYWIYVGTPTNIVGPGSVQTLISKIVGINRK